MSLFDKIYDLALESGFTSAAALDPQKLEFLPEVRAMCNADKCHNYNNSWSCPPACGTLEEMTERAKKYGCGILLQTTAELEDSFDFESMANAEKQHRESFHTFTEKLRGIAPDMFPMGAGGCRICSKCTYPDEPCRFPERMTFSMEACGLLVSQVCKDCDTPYYYGPGTLTYSACVIYNEPKFKSRQNSVEPCEHDGRPAVKKTFSVDGHSEHEAHAMELFRRSGIRVPEEYERSGKVTVYERVSGTTLLKLLESEALTDDILNAFADWLSNCWTALEREFKTPHIIGDMHLANFIWTGNELCGFDFEEHRPGAPEDDLALLLAVIATYSPSFSDYELNVAKQLADAVCRQFPIDRSVLQTSLDSAFGILFSRRGLEPDKENTERVKNLLA